MMKIMMRMLLLTAALAMSACHAETEEAHDSADPYGTLTVTTFPHDARVEFMGSDQAYQPGMRLLADVYLLRVSAPGYVSQEFSYQVETQANFHEVNLQRDFGILRIDATPTGADIQLSYLEGGSLRRTQYTQAMQVPVGEVIIHAEAPGYRALQRSIQLDNAGAALRIVLEADAEVPAATAEHPANQLESPATQE